MGKLIIIEGMDGAGTTTQTKLLAEFLIKCGYKVLSTAQPSKSAIGLEARKLLASSTIEHEPHLLTALALCFAADRMHHVHHTLAPALKTHDFVLVDRYVLSSLVYQGLHLPTSFVKEINRYALEPDVTILMDIDADLAFKRLSARSIAKDFYESPQTLEKIRGRYVHFAALEPQKTIVVDASGSIEEVHSHVVHCIRSKFPI